MKRLLHSKRVCVAALAAILLLIGIAVYFHSWVQFQVSVFQCDSTYAGNLAQRSACWDQILTEHFHAHGVQDALNTLAALYEREPQFVETDCHRHAHVIGDLTYFYMVASTGSADSYDAVPYSPLESACGYGFFGGLLEHLIQNHPDPTLMVATCERLIDKLSGSMLGIEHMCYHTASHGLVLALAEKATPVMAGNADAFIRGPLHSCDTLAAPDNARESCRQGVFHQLFLWKDARSYGFSSDHDREHPFLLCDSEQKAWRHACYFTVAQGFGTWSGYDPVVLSHMASNIQDPNLHRTVFMTGTANIVMPTIHSTSGLAKILHSCETLDATERIECTQAIVHGLYLYGDPQKEYQKAVEFCSSKEASAAGVSSVCFASVAQEDARHYAPEKQSQICSLFPTAYASTCASSCYLPI